MTAFDDITNQHDIDEIEETPNNNSGDPETDQSVDDEQTEVGSNQVDDLYRDAFGNDPDDKTVKQAIDEDEIGRIKDLNQKQQKGK